MLKNGGHILFYTERSHRDEIRSFAALCGRNPEWNEDQIVQELQLHGASEIYAEVLMAFVPLALFRAVLKRLDKASNLVLPQYGFALAQTTDKRFRIEFSAEPVYAAAFGLGEETFSTGIIPRRDLMAASKSSEANSISQCLNENDSLEGMVISPVSFFMLAETPGFFERYNLNP